MPFCAREILNQVTEKCPENETKATICHFMFKESLEENKSQETEVIKQIP